MPETRGQATMGHAFRLIKQRGKNEEKLHSTIEKNSSVSVWFET